MKAINYKDPLSIFRGFYGGILSTNTNIKPEVGEVIVNTAKQGDFAVGMVGRYLGPGDIAEGQEVFGRLSEERVLRVSWKNFPRKIPANFAKIAKPMSFEANTNIARCHLRSMSINKGE